MDQDLESFHNEATPEPLMDEPSQSGTMRAILDIIETLVLSVLLFVGINAISARIRVDGNSMEPSLHDDQFVIVSRLAYKFGLPEHGDVIVFHNPLDSDEEYIKRVIGLPGDNVRIANGEVFINGQEIDEPYIAASPRYNGKWDIPENRLFVLGDNRNNSQDSQEFGPIPLDDVIGEAVFIYWPPPDWGPVAHPESNTASAAPPPPTSEPTQTPVRATPDSPPPTSIEAYP